MIDSSGVVADTEELRARVERDGYLLVRSLLDPERVLQARGVVAGAAARAGWLEPEADAVEALAATGAALQGAGWDDPGWLELQRVALGSAVVRSLAESPALLSVVGKVVGERFQADRGTVCRAALPNDREHVTPPHQDHFYIGRSERLWITWVPLGDCPIDVGPIAVWPGSHKGGLRPHGQVGTSPGVLDLTGASWVSAALRTGDVVLMSTLVVHRALPNLSRTVRLSVDFRFEPEPE